MSPQENTRASEGYSLELGVAKMVNEFWLKGFFLRSSAVRAALSHIADSNEFSNCLPLELGEENPQIITVRV